MTVKVLAFAVVILIFMATRSCYGKNRKRAALYKRKTGKNASSSENTASDEAGVQTEETDADEIKHRFRIYADGIENKMDAKKAEYYFNDTEGIFVKCDTKKGMLALIAKRDIEQNEIEAIAALAGIKITKIEEI